ncbi:MAG: hypothetical protein D4R64_11510 [Porphyromonadaceae bacterium]|nr:MAG: hypothetical protein D4R64_11510 [Porphyromonadaceae bacterium]
MKTLSFPLSSLFLSILFVLFPTSPVNAQHAGIHDTLLSRAEKTAFMETSHNEDVVKFIEALKTSCPLVSVEQFGTTKLGNPMQLVILANPKVSTPEEAKASGKPVIYIQGNIHAGEVEGKEASMEMTSSLITCGPMNSPHLPLMTIFPDLLLIMWDFAIVWEF